MPSFTTPWLLADAVLGLSNFHSVEARYELNVTGHYTRNGSLAKSWSNGVGSYRTPVCRNENVRLPKRQLTVFMFRAGIREPVVSRYVEHLLSY